jgi:hypothetical protein
MGEEWTWRGTPSWSLDGVVAVARPYQGKVKVNFSQGARLPDPRKIFHNGFGGKEWRAIDLLESDQLNESAMKVLIHAAVRFSRFGSEGETLAPSPPTSKSPVKPAGARFKST